MNVIGTQVFQFCDDSNPNSHPNSQVAGEMLVRPHVRP